jgi:hypothetical protein
LRGRAPLQDELDAALEVEPELGWLLGDDNRRDGDQAEDEEQNEEVGASFAHVRLSPPG